MNSLLIKHPTAFALVSAVMATAVLLVSFIFMEPRVALSQTPSDEFEITATITGEISFEVEPTAVTLLPSIPGVTGGTASGTTGFTILTNNASGYTVTIAFDEATAMQRDQGAGSIPNAGATPFANYVRGSTTVNTSSFGFTASGTDVVTALSGSIAGCNTGSANLDSCFLLPADATIAYEFINASGPTGAGGQEFDLAFRVVVEQDPAPALTTGTYTATATLTATEKP